MKRFFTVFLLVILLFCPVKTQALSVSAKGAVLIDGNSGEVLFSKGENLLLPFASTTKIMTALLLCEENNMEKTVTVTKSMVAVEGTSMGLSIGDKVTYEALLYGMMLSSGNDAANATAIAISGSIDAFVEKMNKKAEMLGLENTHFGTPSGLDSKDHLTTAKDLAQLTRFAMMNEDFCQAVKCQQKTVTVGGRKVTLYNHNRLLKTYENAVGVKTGFTKKSGRCLVSAAKNDSVFLIAVTLNDGNDWADHKAMLDYGFSLPKKEIHFIEEGYNIPVIGADEDSITVMCEEKSFTFLSDREVTVKVNLPAYIFAPIKEGTVIGSKEYYCGDTLIFSEELFAGYNVESKREPSLFDIFICNFLKLLRAI